MSHFTVTVCIEDPDKLDAVMAPYDENLEVGPYRSYEEGGPAAYWGTESLRRDAGLNPDDSTLTWAQVAEAHNRHWDDSEPMLVDEDGSAYAMSTRNPQSKWDYWRIGGRWGGYFPYRDGFADRVLKPERNWDSPESVAPRHCDGGPKLALDLNALREEKALEARIAYGEWQKLAAGLPDALPWSAFTDNISPGSGYTIEQAREEYHAQALIKAVNDSDFRWYDDPVAHFGKPESLYVEHARAKAIPGYATITLDGRWMAPGTMGWFAVSDDEEGDRIGYWEAANAYINSLDDAAWLVVLDCHI
jgi:hypothetical protein